MHFTKQLAVELQEICKDVTVAKVADHAGCDEKAIIGFLTGEPSAGVEFIFRVEHALEAKLWSHDHLSPQWVNSVNDSERA